MFTQFPYNIMCSYNLITDKNNTDTTLFHIVIGLTHKMNILPQTIYLI